MKDVVTIAVGNTVANPVLCDVCDKSMYDEDSGTNLIGMSITINCLIGLEVPFYQKQMGDFKLGRQYNVCCECWLKSLGLKPEGEKNSGKDKSSDLQRKS